MNESTLVPREELSDLDWLARNVHEWPTSTPHIVPPGDSVFDFGITFYKNHAFMSRYEYTHSKAVYKKQWLARRAELQNKPSWKDAPEWAEWLAQDSYGCWGWYQIRPVTLSLNWFAHSGYYSTNSPGNSILGDWHDTLEKRPEQKAFEPLTSIKDNQEKNMKQDNEWFERGELPPVGSSVTVVEVDGLKLSDLGREFVGEECKVMAVFTRPELSHSDAVDVVAVMEPRGGCCCFVLEMIRPIRTERDELADLIESHGQMSALVVADAILAAGFSLGAK